VLSFHSGVELNDTDESWLEFIQIL